MWSSGAMGRSGRAGAARVGEPIGDAYVAWREADAAARAFERAVTESWSRYERGVGEPPSRGLLREAAALRQIAREKLREVVDLLHAVGPAAAPARAGAWSN